MKHSGRVFPTDRRKSKICHVICRICSNPIVVNREPSGHQDYFVLIFTMNAINFQSYQRFVPAFINNEPIKLLLDTVCDVTDTIAAE